MTYRKIRVTDADRCVRRIEPIHEDSPPPWSRGVRQEPKTDWPPPAPAGRPWFAMPIAFIVPPPEGSGEPFHPHNHCPAITWCPNGDLLAAWFSTNLESGTEMTILASRLRAGADAWDGAAEFFKASGRNMTGTALFHDGGGRLYHFNGVGRPGLAAADE